MGGYSCFGCDSTEFIMGYNRYVTGDTLPIRINPLTLEYYDGTPWMQSRYSTETKKGAVKTPVQVMDSGIKVEVFETRDTIYKCPVSNMIYFSYNGTMLNGNKERFDNCTVDKVVTCRNYRFYIINEEGKKEYLELDISKNK